MYAEVSCEIRVKMRTDHMRHWYWTSSSSQAWTMSDLTDELCGLDSRKGKLNRWSISDTISRTIDQEMRLFGKF